MQLQVLVNAALNVFGFIIPAISGVLVVPVLLENLGASRVGVLALIMGMYGFTFLYDAGFSRAIALNVAECDSRGALPLAARPVARLFGMALALALTASFLLYQGSAFAVEHFARVPVTLRSDAAASVGWFALSLPILSVFSCFAAVLEGTRRFATLNFFRTLINTFSIIVPALWSFASQTLEAYFIIVFMVRLLGLMLLGFYLVRTLLPIKNDAVCMESISNRVPDDRSLAFAGWVSFSHFLSPFIVYLDRYALGFSFPASALPPYTVPQEAGMRALAIPGAAVGVVFPELAKHGVMSNYAKSLRFKINCLLLIFWGLPIFLMGIFLWDVLALWVDEDFATASLGYAKWLLLGVLANGFAHLPLINLLAARCARVVAVTHLIELPCYMSLLWLMISELGVLGAAIAWAVRIVFDTFVLTILSSKSCDDDASLILSGLGGAAAMILVYVVWVF